MKDYFCMWLQYYVLFFWDFSDHKHFLWEIFNLHFVHSPLTYRATTSVQTEMRKNGGGEMSSSDQFNFFSFLCELKTGKKEKLFHFTSASSSLFVLAIHGKKQHSKFPELVHLTAHVMTTRQQPFFFHIFFLHDHIHKMIVSLQRIRLGCEWGWATRCWWWGGVESGWST